jgi:hypothetical protein
MNKFIHLSNDSALCMKAQNSNEKKEQEKKRERERERWKAV